MKRPWSDPVLVHEARTELKGSIAGLSLLAGVTAFQAYLFHDRADPTRFSIWLAVMVLFLTGSFGAWVVYLTGPLSDEVILTRWIPAAKIGMTIANMATAFSVWVFLPVAGTELAVLVMVVLACHLIVQFAAATEATQVLTSAVILVLGSLTAWLVTARPPDFLPLALFLPLFGLTLIGIRRFVREAVIRSRAAQAAADDARADLQDALAALERERDAKTHFIRAASHDLQQPLQAANLYLESLRLGGRMGDQAAALGGLRQALTATRALVGSMLDHLKLEGGSVRPEMSTFPASELFDRVLLTQGPAASAEGLQIRTVGARARLYADILLLGRAVENLVANAIRHSGGRRILLGARACQAETRIWVIDDGVGLGEGDVERIFTPFEQGAHVGPAGGFGLGLAVSRELVALMGGDCGVRRDLTCGSAFWISLPAKDPGAR